MTLRVRRNQDAVVRGLAAVNGVTKAVNTGNFIEVEANGDETTVEQIASFVVGQGAGLVELKVQSLALEDIFIKLTSAQAAH